VLLLSALLLLLSFWKCCQCLQSMRQALRLSCIKWRLRT
jgi:hypothetical protein